MDLSFKSLKEKNDGKNYFWDFKGVYDFVDEWYLMGTPIPVLIIIASYLIFVLKIGPYMMKYREPFKLTTLLGFYNGAQVIASCFMFKVALDLTIREGIFQKKCMSTPEAINQLTSATYYFLICKLTELLDTVFFVLRKKQSQVTFLHVYHHALVVVSTWSILKYDPSYVGLFLGLFNSLVHAVMYSYYGLSAFPSLTKYLWWKKYITKLQLTQFVLILLQLIINQATSECKVSTPTMTVLFVNLLLFIYLFARFYKNTYSAKDEAQNTGKVDQMNTNGSQNRISKNGDARKWQ